MNDAGRLQQLAKEFVDAAAQYGTARDAGRLERLRNLRLQIANALLDLPAPAIQDDFANTLQAIVGACVRSGMRSVPRSPAENEVFARCLEHLTPWQPHLAPAQGMAALLLAQHAFELKFVPPINSLPAATRAGWLYYLCELPPAFANFGDADEYALYLRMLCERVGDYLTHAADTASDVISNFNSTPIFMQLYSNEFNLRDCMRERGKIIERYLEHGGANLDQLCVLRPIRDRPRIGFIIMSLGDSAETVFLAAHMEHLDRRRYDIRLYSLFEPSGGVGVRCRSWADSYVCLPNQALDAVTRLRREDLDVAIFCTNLTARTHMLTEIAAHRVARIQVSTIATPITTGFRNMDVMISGELNETEDAPEHYTERLIRLPGALNCYPFQYMLTGMPDPGPISRTALGIPEKCTLFFSSANFYKILPELSQQWIDILRQVPDSYLLLMPFNPNWLSNYPADSLFARLSRQVTEAGLAPQRIRVLNQVPTTSHLQKIIGLADVYLDSFPFSGACSLFDPLVVGVPVVACMGKTCRSRHSKAILEELGLADWVTKDSSSYVQAAVELGLNPQKRDAERERLAQARATRWRLGDTAGYAAKLMPAFDGLLSDWNERVYETRAIDGAQLNYRIAMIAGEIGKRIPSFTDQNLVVSLVLPYLREGGSKRLIDVGACMGAMTKPFLDEGWQAVMFEPDSRCHAQLTALVNVNVGRAQLEMAAVTAGQKGCVAFHVASLPGLSGLSSSPYAPDISTVDVPAIMLAPYIESKNWDDVDFIKIDAEGHDIDILRSIDFGKVSPRLVMVEFGDQFAGQDRDSITAALQEMRMRGYHACVFCLHALGKFERHEWGTRLLAICVDEVPAVAVEERLFGNILFFREADHDFLPSVYDWLEQLRKWH